MSLRHWTYDLYVLVSNTYSLKLESMYIRGANGLDFRSPAHPDQNLVSPEPIYILAQLKTFIIYIPQDPTAH